MAWKYVRFVGQWRSKHIFLALVGMCFANSGPLWHTQEEVQAQAEIEAGTRSVLCVTRRGLLVDGFSTDFPALLDLDMC